MTPIIYTASKMNPDQFVAGALRSPPSKIPDHVFDRMEQELAAEDLPVIKEVNIPRRERVRHDTWTGTASGVISDLKKYGKRRG
jgi:hypothetical protein